MNKIFNNKDVFIILIFAICCTIIVHLGTRSPEIIITTPEGETVEVK